MNPANAIIQACIESSDQADWTLGRLAKQWLELKPSERAGIPEDGLAVMIGRNRDFVEERRAVFARFGEIRHTFKNLTWGHFKAAMAWPDRDPVDGLEGGSVACLRWANEVKATLAEMRAWRRAQRGEDLSIDEGVAQL